MRVLVQHAGFRKLFTVRLLSQCGDGMFQIGLAALFFFSPQNLATATQVAGAFAVMLLPFTIVGPFAGPLLDRWSRRQVLAIGNSVRVVLTLAIAAIMVTSGIGPAIYVLALLTLATNRFLLAALSAGLPRVVPADQLLIANSLTPTLGGASAVAGAGLGVVINLVTPTGPWHDATVLLVTAAFMLAAVVAAMRLHRGELGPDRSATELSVLGQLGATTRDLVDGARYLVARRTPALALGAMAAHRFIYGVNFIALILISRNLLVDPGDASAGLAMFGLLSGISFAGGGLAIVATPIAHQFLRPSAWVITCLGVGIVSQLLIATTPTIAVIAVAALLLGLSTQGAKIAVDTIVQRDTHDRFRGRAFTLYDTFYNAAFTGAAAVAALALPDTGWSRATFLPLAGLYVLIATGYGLGTRRTHDRPAAIPER
nr:MFS transporter [Pseudactinotalea sp. HY160]